MRFARVTLTCVAYSIQTLSTALYATEKPPCIGSKVRLDRTFTSGITYAYTVRVYVKMQLHFESLTHSVLTFVNYGCK